MSAELPPPLAGLGEHLAERHRVFRGIVEVLTALGPTILVLEDLHWADDVTTELLRFVSDRLPPELVLSSACGGSKANSRCSRAARG